MKLLALDTSSLACTVALQTDGAIIERHEELPREHTRLLVPMIGDVLAEAGLALRDLDAIVLGNGPGSFIGMRIAASVAQGMAHGAGLNIVPVSSLAVIAAQVFAETDATSVIVAQDAHMNEVYLGGFDKDATGLPRVSLPERLHGTAPLEGIGDERPAAAGFGWQRYPELLAANKERLGPLTAIWHPCAKYLLAPGAAGLEKGAAIEPQALNPAYLRQKVAQRPAPPA